MNFSIAQGNTLPVKLEQMLDYLLMQKYVQMFAQMYTLSPRFCAILKNRKGASSLAPRSLTTLYRASHKRQRHRHRHRHKRLSNGNGSSSSTKSSLIPR